MIKFGNNVSKTLFIPLYMRYLDAISKEPILGDDKAKELVNSLKTSGKFDFSEFKSCPMTLVGTAIRAQFFDDCAVEFCKENNQFERIIVDVAAGLDTRKNRLKNRCEAIFYELDLPDVVELKIELLGQDGDNFISSSMLDTAWMDKLAAKHKNARFIFICEGVAMYLKEAEFLGFLRNLKARFKGQVAFDLMNSFAAKVSQKGKHETLKDAGAMVQFWLDEPRELENAGIRLLKSENMLEIYPQKWCLKAKIMRFLMPKFRRAMSLNLFEL